MDEIKQNRKQKKPGRVLLVAQYVYSDSKQGYDAQCPYWRWRKKRADVIGEYKARLKNCSRCCETAVVQSVFDNIGIRFGIFLKVIGANLLAAAGKYHQSDKKKKQDYFFLTDIKIQCLAKSSCREYGENDVKGGHRLLLSECGNNA